MERFFPSQIFIGDTIERSFQCKQDGTPIDITGETWTMLVKDNPNKPDDDALISVQATPYDEGFAQGKGRFEAASDNLKPTTYWFFIRRESAGIRDTIVSEQVRMINR